MPIRAWALPSPAAQATAVASPCATTVPVGPIAAPTASTIYVFIGANSNGTPPNVNTMTGVTDNLSDSFSFVGSNVGGLNNTDGYLFCASNVAGGSTTVSVVTTGGIGLCTTDINAVAFTGGPTCSVDQSQKGKANNSLTQNSTAAPLATHSNDLILGNFSVGFSGATGISSLSGTNFPATGWTALTLAELTNGSNISGLYPYYNNASSADNYRLGATLNSTTFGGVFIEAMIVPTATPTATATTTPTPTASATPTASVTPTPTASATPTPTATATATATVSTTPTPTMSATPTATATPTRCGRTTRGCGHFLF